MPAARLAQKGFQPADILLNDIRSSYERFAKRTNFADYFGEINAAELFRQADLAATLKRRAQSGPDEFYRGETATLPLIERDAIISCCRWI